MARSSPISTLPRRMNSACRRDLKQPNPQNPKTEATSSLRVRHEKATSTKRILFGFVDHRFGDRIYAGKPQVRDNRESVGSDKELLFFWDSFGRSPGRPAFGRYRHFIYGNRSSRRVC